MLPVQPKPRRSPSRPVTTTFDLAFISLIITSLLSSHIPGAVAQGATNATCNSGFEWMFNSKGQSPCLVSSWLLTPCSSPFESFVYPLSPGFHYNTPLNSSDSATPCRCNTVLFSTISACATCQGEGQYIVPYPENIPSGTTITAWAYLDVRVNNTFDPAAAEAVAAQNLPESSAQPAPSTTQTSEPSTGTPTSPSTTTGGIANDTPTATGDTSSSSSEKKSNTGAIAGGVVGGVAGLALVCAAVFFALKLRSSRSGAPSSNPVHYTGADTQVLETSPVRSVSTHRFYDPNDPATFPGQDPFGSRSLQAASVAYSAGVASSNGDTGVATQNPYRGAPEL
ncbi:hypothetical protein V8D89_005456 [Ganoderma adspersum]